MARNEKRGSRQRRVSNCGGCPVATNAGRKIELPVAAKNCCAHARQVVALFLLSAQATVGARAFRKCVATSTPVVALALRVLFVATALNGAA